MARDGTVDRRSKRLLLLKRSPVSTARPLLRKEIDDAAGKEAGGGNL